MRTIIPEWVQKRYGDYLPDHILRNRPTKTALGMSKTAKRSGHKLDGAALSLAVRGTTMKGYKFYFSTRSDKVCPCCGERSTKLMMHPDAKMQLERMRAKRAKQEN